MSLVNYYSELSNKYSLEEKKSVCHWTLSLPGAGCEYCKQGDGCTMCGFKNSTKKYTMGLLFPTIVFESMFNMAEKAVRLSNPKELFIFNGGSFLNKKEIPLSFQNYLFQWFGTNNSVNRLFVETRCDYIDSARLLEIKKMVGNKTVSIGIGLESQDDYIRNKVIKKGLSKVKFEETVRCVHQYGFKVSAYVFLKPLGLDEKSAYMETVETIKYALSLGVDEIHVSCAFIQVKTVMFDEFMKGSFRPPYLWTIIALIEKIIKNDWPVLIGGFTDEPPPIAIPSNCDKCSPAIYSVIENFRQRRILSEIPNCSCYDNWCRL